MSNGWIGVDLDATLAEYAGFQGPEHIGKPIPAMVEKVLMKLAEGVDVRIFTARVSPLETVLEMVGGPSFLKDSAGCVLRGLLDEETKRIRRHIEAWCQRHLGRTLPITCVKDFTCREIWDDRSKEVIPNTGLFLEETMEPKP